MNVKIFRKALLDALNSVSVALSSKCANPYGMFVMLKADGELLTIIADSIQLRAEATVKCTVKTSGMALISHSKLVALLQREGASVLLSADDKRLKVELGTSLTHLPPMPADTFPAPRADGEQKAFVILDNQAFANSLAIVCQFSGNGVDHIWNTGLGIEDDGTNLVLAACDGHRFGRLLLPTSGGAFKAAVLAELIRKTVAPINASESLTMSVFERSVKLDMDGLSVQIQQVESPYPMKQVLTVCERMDKNCCNSITVDRATLMSEIAIAAGVVEQDEDAVGIEITTQPQQLLISAISKSSADHANPIDTKATVALPRRRINHAHLTSYLRSLDYELVTLYYEPTFSEPGYRITPTGVDAVSGYVGFFKNV